jgi:head-tail adaptor
MKDGATKETFDRMAGKTVDAMTLWAEANQRVLREMVELGAGTVKEGVRLYAELQRTTIEAVREGQASALRWQNGWREFPTDPAALYRGAIAEGMTGTQQMFRLAEEGALAVSRSAERMQAAAEAATKGIQEACTGTVAKLKDIYGQE